LTSSSGIRGAASNASSGGSVETVLAVDGLNTTFRTHDGPVPAVRDVSFELRKGEFLGLVGESGCGKSTVLMSILRLLPENADMDARTLLFEDRDVLDLSDEEIRLLRGRRISLIPQRPMSSLSPVATSERQLKWYLQRDGARRSEELTGAMESMLDRVGLRAAVERLSGYPYQFSGGQLQRMLIAIAALVGEPDVLMADEPTTTLDVTVQAQVLSLLLEARDRLGLSVIIVTHDLGVIAQTCDRVAVMYGGRLVEMADVNTLFHEPRHPYTIALLDSLPSRHRRGEPLTSIEGSAIGSNLLDGCPFAPRCPSVMDNCHTDVPEERTVGETFVRCHLYSGADHG
jgi:oligopeptide/dipeptide ABC transporter ATP-binding protein